uniref:Putative ribonuclease H-like domain-containing protein n=1 Tax=Tanacetum cinerariifolium TaxID=118510 RepID=A0A699H014_TANCI|nr:putative ribonuclease H-like domain-containing protein [Tanacetum cinerariifolium]
MNYVPVVAGTSSTNISGTKKDVHQAVKEKESSLRFISLLNWFHEAQMKTSNEDAKKDDAIPDNNSPPKEQQEVNGDKEVPESSRNSNPTASLKVFTNDSFELASSSTVETKVPTVSSLVPTDSLSVPLVTLSVPRIISRGGSSFPKPLSLGNAMSFENRLEDFFGDTSNAVSMNEVEANLSNMKTAIQVSPTPTLIIHKDHPKSQIIGHVDTPVQTRQKTKDVDEQSFIATIHQKTNLDLLQTNDEEVYVMQPPGFQDPKFPHRVYKVEKAMYGLYQAPRACYGTLSKYLLDNGFQRGTIDQTLFVRKHKGEFLLVQVYVNDIIFGSSNPKLCREFKALMHDKFQMSAMGELNFFLGLQVLQKKDGIFLSQEKYVGDILKKFGYTDIRAAKTPMVSKRYKLGLWYLKESPFDLVAYSDNDYGGANQDRKSTTVGCQFLERRLISWPCKMQTIVVTSTTEAEYVVAASGYEQVLWIQNQLLDYGYNFMNTKIYIDNNSAICIVKNTVYHSKTKHNEIRHHFIRECYEKKLINVDHIHTYDNVADLLTKAFDVERFQFLVVSIEMLNP